MDINPKISLSEYLTSGLIENDLTMKVFRQILSISSKEELDSIEFGKPYRIPGEKYVADIYLGAGIKNIGWPDKTVIEVKNFIDERFLRSIYRIFKKLKDIKKFILIYHKTNFSDTPTFQDIDERFNIVNLDEFINLSMPHVNNYIENVGDKKNEEYSTEENFISEDKDRNILSCGDWRSKRDNLLEELQKDISSDATTLILGAGVSASANMPSWTKLLESLLIKHAKSGAPNYYPCDLTNVLHACGESNIIAARYINYIIDGKERAKIIQETLYKNKKDSKLIESICGLIKTHSITQAITTNYDQLIEQGLRKQGLNPYPVSHSGVIPKGCFPVYHVHGSVNDPDNPLQDDTPIAPVLSEEDYHALYAAGHHWSNTAILHSFQHSHCILIGLSMTDPNLRRLIESAHYEDLAPHYIFMPRQPLYGGYYPDDKRNLYHYMVQEDIMWSLGIRVIWYEINQDGENRHNELENLIENLANSQYNYIDNNLEKHTE